MAALATYTYKLSMDYWPATYWVPASGDWTCTLPGAPSVGADSCALAPDGQKLRRIEIRPGVTSYPSGRSHAAELQNFANWFQYHRKRRLSANAAVGDTLESLRGLRMGSVRMGSLPAASTRVTMYDLDSNTAAANGQALLKFLYEIDTNLGTPTRQMLKRMGDEFQNSAGPIQYACQRNVSLVVTDGYASAVDVAPPGYNSASWGSGAPYATTYGGTLADIALSYYTNTMGSASFPTGKVPPSATDANTNLHMNTYAVTLGARGDLFNGESTPYPTATSAWVDPNTDFNPSAVDDLWHATINGRGKLYLASAASDTAAKLQSAFSDILSQQGAQGGIAVSTVNLQRGDQRAYVGTYNPAGWTGDLTAVAINATTGATAATPSWSAGALLLARDWTTRVIASHDGSAGVPFTEAAVGSLVNPSSTWGVTSELMAYLRGDRSNEGTKFRTRSSLLGAVINSEPFVSRDDGVVYVASGEGMLHAFDTRDQPGKELWAYVPRSVLPDIGQTSARSYAFNTQLDGSPVVGKTGTSSKLLVAGTGAAGRSYYAIDVSSPRGLSEADLATRVKWEFPAASDTATQAKVGQTLGRPSVVKLGDGSYAVLVSSGYNNTADGKGRLWMLNPANGAVVAEMVTADGSLASESGLTHFSPFVEGDGTVRYVFGGDLLGNVWKFDLVARTAPVKVAVLKNAAGTVQPVTAPPELLWYANKRIVLIGTGRLLDITDFGNSSVQSFYAIADGATLANARSSLVQQTYTRATDTVSTNPVNWTTGRGWFMDLPAGEQENTRPVLSRGAISFVTNVAGGSDCTASSYLYVLDVLTGQKFAGATFAGTQISATTNSSGVNALLTDGGTGAGCVSDCPPPPPPPPGGDCQHIVGTGQTADGTTWRRDITTCVTINPSKNAWREIRR
jgi:type IV pilus assembly protein PilY1